MTDVTAHRAKRALVTGASGYIGGLLVPALLSQGWTVRVLTRSAGSVEGRSWRREIEIVEGDASAAADLRTALDGVDTAYYLIHSMDSRGDFVTRDRELATTFAKAAADASVGRIVYLGGLHPKGDELSDHMASRAEVGRIFLDSPTPATVLQAAVILGDGSASFDMLRFLAGRLPGMIAPKWLRNRIQPIAASDAIACLVAAATMSADVNRTFDIGGPDVLTYEQLIQRYAAVTGIPRRVIVAVPVLTPRLASHWVGLVTPIKAGLARPLVGSLVHEVVCQEHDIDGYLPAPPSIGVDEAIRQAMATATPDTGPRNLVASAAAVAACAVAGSLATQPGSRWYRDLDLPPWQPPGAAFPLVWTTLYADIAAVSAATLTTLEREGRTREARGYRAALAANLVLNAGWSWVFFRAHKLPAATAGAVLLAASSADLARRADATGSVRGRSLLPYAGWTAFASLLTAEVTRRNRRRS